LARTLPSVQSAKNSDGPSVDVAGRLRDALWRPSMSKGGDNQVTAELVANFADIMPDATSASGFRGSNPFDSSQRGTWAHTDGHEFALTFIKGSLTLWGIFRAL